MIYLITLLCITSHHDVFNTMDVLESETKCKQEKVSFYENKVFKESCTKTFKATCYELNGKEID